MGCDVIVAATETLGAKPGVYKDRLQPRGNPNSLRNTAPENQRKTRPEMTNIQLVSQPEKAPKDEKHTLEKLQELVRENPLADDLEEEKGAHQLSHVDPKNNAVPESPVMDDDGFEIPPGKIPIDGHFLTHEIKQLVTLAQKEGLLDNSVQVSVVETNDVVGDKIVISEKNEERRQEGATGPVKSQSEKEDEE